MVHESRSQEGHLDAALWRVGIAMWQLLIDPADVRHIRPETTAEVLVVAQQQRAGVQTCMGSRNTIQCAT